MCHDFSILLVKYAIFCSDMKQVWTIMHIFTGKTKMGLAMQPEIWVRKIVGPMEWVSQHAVQENSKTWNSLLGIQRF